MLRARMLPAKLPEKSVVRLVSWRSALFVMGLLSPLPKIVSFIHTQRRTEKKWLKKVRRVSRRETELSFKKCCAVLPPVLRSPLSLQAPYDDEARPHSAAP